MLRFYVKNREQVEIIVGIRRTFSLILGIVFCILGTGSIATADESIKSFERPHGWTAIGVQTDPFNQNVVDIVQIFKDDFIFDCRTASFISEYDVLFDSFSFGADVQYQVDGRKVVKQGATYSTYFGGVSMVNNSRYFSFRMDKNDIQAFKKGLNLIVAAKTAGLGWINKGLDLRGFTARFTEMCE